MAAYQYPVTFATGKIGTIDSDTPLSPDQLQTHLDAYNQQDVSDAAAASARASADAQEGTVGSLLGGGVRSFVNPLAGFTRGLGEAFDVPTLIRGGNELQTRTATDFPVNPQVADTIPAKVINSATGLAGAALPFTIPVLGEVAGPATIIPQTYDSGYQQAVAAGAPASTVQNYALANTAVQAPLMIAGGRVARGLLGAGEEAAVAGAPPVPGAALRNLGVGAAEAGAIGGGSRLAENALVGTHGFNLDPNRDILDDVPSSAAYMAAGAGLFGAVPAVLQSFAARGTPANPATGPTVAPDPAAAAAAALASPAVATPVQSSAQTVANAVGDMQTIADQWKAAMAGQRPAPVLTPEQIAVGNAMLTAPPAPPAEAAPGGAATPATPAPPVDPLVPGDASTPPPTPPAPLTVNDAIDSNAKVEWNGIRGRVSRGDGNQLLLSTPQGDYTVGNNVPDGTALADTGITPTQPDRLQAQVVDNMNAVDAHPQGDVIHDAYDAAVQATEPKWYKDATSHPLLSEVSDLLDLGNSQLADTGAQIAQSPEYQQQLAQYPKARLDRAENIVVNSLDRVEKQDAPEWMKNAWAAPLESLWHGIQTIRQVKAQYGNSEESTAAPEEEEAQNLPGLRGAPSDRGGVPPAPADSGGNATTTAAFDTPSPAAPHRAAAAASDGAVAGAVQKAATTAAAVEAVSPQTAEALRQKAEATLAQSVTPEPAAALPVPPGPAVESESPSRISPPPDAPAPPPVGQDTAGPRDEGQVLSPSPDASTAPDLGQPMHMTRAQFNTNFEQAFPNGDADKAWTQGVQKGVIIPVDDQGRPVQVVQSAPTEAADRTPVAERKLIKKPFADRMVSNKLTDPDLQISPADSAALTLEAQRRAETIVARTPAMEPFSIPLQEEIELRARQFIRDKAGVDQPAGNGAPVENESPIEALRGVNEKGKRFSWDTVARTAASDIDRSPEYRATRRTQSLDEPVGEDGGASKADVLSESSTDQTPADDLISDEEAFSVHSKAGQILHSYLSTLPDDAARTEFLSVFKKVAQGYDLDDLDPAEQSLWENFQDHAHTNHAEVRRSEPEAQEPGEVRPLGSAQADAPAADAGTGGIEAGGRSEDARQAGPRNQDAANPRGETAPGRGEDVGRAPEGTTGTGKVDIRAGARVTYGRRAATVEMIDGDKVTIRVKGSRRTVDVDASELKPPVRRSFTLPQGPHGSMDILDRIEEEGGMLSPARYKERVAAGLQQRGGEYDGAPGMEDEPLKGVYHNSVFKGTMGPDQMAGLLADSGHLREADPQEMWPAIREAINARRAARDNEVTQRAQEQEHEQAAKVTAKQKTSFDRDTTTPKRGLQPIEASELSVGQKVRVGGQSLRVIDVDPDNFDVTLEDHEKYGVQTVKDGDTLYVQKVGRAPRAADAEVPEPEPPARPGAAVDNAADMFGHADARVAPEELARQERMRQMRELQSQRLTAGDIDTTGDMLDPDKEDNPLFSQPVRAAAGKSSAPRTFGQQVADAVRAVGPEGRAGKEGDKVFISRAFDAYRQQGGKLDLPTFKQALSEARTAGDLSLSRADLGGAFDVLTLKASETAHHFFPDEISHFINNGKGTAFDSGKDSGLQPAHAQALDNAVSAARDAFKKIGVPITETADTDFRGMAASYNAAGDVSFEIGRDALARTIESSPALSENPAAARDFIERGVSEELAHASDLMDMRQRWAQEGRKGSFKDFVAADKQELLAQTREDFDSLSPKNKALANGAFLDGWNLYHNPDDLPPVRDAAEAGQRVRAGDSLFGFDNTDHLFQFLDENPDQVAPYMMETLRQLMQLRESNPQITTETGYLQIVQRIRDYVDSLLRRLRSLASNPETYSPALADTINRIESAQRGEPYVSPRDDPGGTRSQVAPVRTRTLPPGGRAAVMAQAHDEIDIRNPNKGRLEKLNSGVREDLAGLFDPAGQAFKDIKNTLFPAGASTAAKEVGETLRSEAGTGGMAAARYRGQKQLERAVRAFGSMKLDTAEGQKGSLDIQDRIERGVAQADPKLQPFADQMRAMLDDLKGQIQALGTGKLNDFVKDYFPHLWKTPEEAAQMYANFLGKRPLEGPAGALKARTIDYLAEGVAQGLEPVTWNPAEAVMLRIHEMQRYIMAHKLTAELERQGNAQPLATEAQARSWPAIRAKMNRGHALTNEQQGIYNSFIGTHTLDTPLTTEPDAGNTTIRLAGQTFQMQADAAKIIQNYLSPGLQGKAAFDVVRKMGNLFNQAQLGFSFFHAGFVTLDTTFSKASLGLGQISRGIQEGNGSKIAEGIASMAKAAVPLYAPIETILRGSKVLAEYDAPGSVGGEFRRYADALEKGGGRVSPDSFYDSGAIKSFRDAWAKGNVVGAVFRAPMAVMEGMSHPLMHWMVPRVKLGVFADLAREEYARLGPGATPEQERAAYARAWDTVDNRLGQVVYDNIFWNKTLKDSLMLGVRSVGWNLGTIRELGGGVLDANPTRILQRLRDGDNVITPRLGYVMTLPIMAGIYGSLLQYLHTGQGPQNLKDMLFPRTGKKNPDGSDERLTQPTYLKDVLSYEKHPVQTLVNKANPIINMLAEMYQNKDFYGGEIRNGNDPLMKQAMQELGYIVRTPTPFSIRNIGQRRSGGTASAVESMVGITPAPADLSRTPAENAMVEAIRRQLPSGGKTPEEMERAALRKTMMANAQGGQDITPQLQQAVEDRQMTPQAARKFVSDSRLDPKLRMFRSLDVDDARRVYDLGNPDEQKMFLTPLRAKEAKAGMPLTTLSGALR